MNCRHCQSELTLTMLDLGSAPPSNAYLTLETLSCPEKYYPLRVLVCTECWLAQTDDYTQADELFDANYAYFSSTSTGWLDHAAQYAEKMTLLLGLTQQSMVIEVASNDGYLLKNFVAAGIPCLGIEPTASTAAAAEQLGITVMREFFGESIGKQLAITGNQADLIIGNNVYAHVPDINDFTKGLKEALKPNGTITLEFPHLMRLIEHTQFDTIYHEHFSYLSLFTVSRIFQAVNLRVYDIEELSTHGGSLRIFGCHADDKRAISKGVLEMIAEEAHRGLQTEHIYNDFQFKADKVKDNLLTFLIEQKRAGNKVAAYGAAAKGSTLLNYAGVKPDLLPFVCDASASKQGRFMPGSHIPIVDPTKLYEQRPDYLVILPWNIAPEVMQKNAGLAELGTKFVTAVPRLNII
jgi:hypothetical protein